MSENFSGLNDLSLSIKNHNNLNINTKINVNDPEFKKLTAAEKLNNSKYWSLIYRTNPNEPTCGCKSAITEQSTTIIQDIGNHKSNVDFLVCPGGCKKSCCSRAMRFCVAKNQDNGNYDKVLRIMSTYCVGNQPSNKVYNGTLCPDGRIRGGGGVEEENCEYENLGLAEYLKNVRNARLCGQGFRYPSRYDVEDPNKINTYFLPSKFYNISPKPSNYQFDSSPNYIYSDQEKALKLPESHEKICTRRCMHIKCLTQKFKEAQEFVDSLGEAPGLPGLDLIDLSKSPHYRAFKESELEGIKRTFSTQLPIVNPQCGGPYNTAIKSTSTSPWIKATPFTIAVPGRGGIVQEAIIPGAYEKDKYKTGEINEDSETGPCRESMCKARRKKIDRERLSVAVNSGIELNEEKKSKNNKRNKKYKFRRRRRQIMENSESNFKSRNKLKKIRYVYLGGETYPGFIYGHKNCSGRLKRVPANMGWFWTQYETVGRMKPRIGWKPGAISRQIREIIKDVRDGLIEKRSKTSLTSSIEIRGKKLKSKSAMSLRKGHLKKFEEEEELEPPPTLHIQRREGIYYVTMYPIKKEDMNVSKLNEPTKPLQLKINPKKDDNSDETSSTVSDMEIEFSPPAAVNRYRRKPNVVHVDTQVKQQEIIDAFKPTVDKKKEKKEPKKKSKKRTKS